MTETVNIEQSSITVLIEVDGIVHLVAMEKDKYEAISFLTKQSVYRLIKTSRSQAELREFLGVRA